MNRQYQKYLQKTHQKAPEASGRKYYFVPKAYNDRVSKDTNVDLVSTDTNKESQDEEC